MAPQTFRPGIDGSAHGAPTDHVIAVGPGGSIAVLTLEDLVGISPEEERKHFLGEMDGQGVWAVDVPEGVELPIPMTPLIMTHGQLGDLWWAVAGRGVQISQWWRTHRYCGGCGKPNELRDSERALGCDDCKVLAYPRLAPAVIVLIHRDREVLLARGRSFGAPMYSTLAGFVEPGESLEQCVAREVKEEVGVDVDEITYRTSQPWPFPHSLMIGFWARWSGGDIDIDESEIADAQWYPIDALPNIPPPFAISRWLIDAYVESVA
ncbi:MAG TPA: NAD(+) diphosphatase [Acidimicrobiales bacterium]|nr:NAD(+) diphosphatase [Acidimicrobiales bacterium]